MSLDDSFDSLFMFPEPAGQTSGHETGGKSLAVLAANGIIVEEAIKSPDHPELGGKTFTSYKTVHPLASSKNVPGHQSPPTSVCSNTIVEHLSENPETLDSILEDEPEILADCFERNPALLWNYIQSKPAMLRTFFQAKPESFSYLLSSNTDMLSNFCNSHPAFMSAWLKSQQATVQMYLQDNPALFWNHIRSHTAYQSGGQIPFNQQFTAGLCFDIPKDQIHLVCDPVQWTLPKDPKRRKSKIQELAAHGQGTTSIEGNGIGIINDDGFLDPEHLVQLAEEDEAGYDASVHDFVAIGVDNIDYDASSIIFNSSRESSPEIPICKSIRYADMYGVYPSDDEACEAKRSLPKINVLEESESVCEDGSDYVDESSEDEIVGTGRRQVREVKAVKGVIVADPGMKIVRKTHGGKGGFVQVPIDDDEEYEDEDHDQTSEEEDHDTVDAVNAGTTLPAPPTPPRALVPYPAPRRLVEASRSEPIGKKWRLFEEDLVIGHMLDIRREGKLVGEDRFRETADRLVFIDGVNRKWGGVKNFWNRTGRARSGFDERKNKRAPLATSRQLGKKKKKAANKKGSTASTTPAVTTTPKSCGAKSSATSPSMKTNQSSDTELPKTPAKASSKKSLQPLSPTSAKRTVAKKPVTPDQQNNEQATFTLEDIKKIRAEIEAKAEAKAKAAAEACLASTVDAKLEALFDKRIARAAAELAPVKHHSDKATNEKRGRDSHADFEQGEISEEPQPKRPRASAPAENTDYDRYLARLRQERDEERRRRFSTNAYSDPRRGEHQFRSGLWSRDSDHNRGRSNDRDYNSYHDDDHDNDRDNDRDRYNRRHNGNYRRDSSRSGHKSSRNGSYRGRDSRR